MRIYFTKLQSFTIKVVAVKGVLQHILIFFSLFLRFCFFLFTGLMCANGSYTSEATQDKTTKVLHTSSYKWTLSEVCFIFLHRRYSLSRVQRKRRWWALGEWISNDQTRTFVKEPVSIHSFSLLNSSCAWDCFPEVI